MEMTVLNCRWIETNAGMGSSKGVKRDAVHVSHFTRIGDASIVRFQKAWRIKRPTYCPFYQKALPIWVFSLK